MGKNNDKKMDQKAMLDAYIAKFGLNVIVGDVIGEIDTEMTFDEFLNQIETKGVNELVMEMTLGELFGLKPKTTEQNVIKDGVLKLLEKKTDLMVSEIGEALGEKGKHLSVAMAALKKGGKVVTTGQKRNMRYSLPKQ